MKITEKNYLEQLNRGNEAALCYVMKQYGGLVKSVVHRHLYNLTQYEEDCINDIFYAVWTHISSYQPERNSFANWIAGVARLKALDYVRGHAKQLQEVHLEQPMVEVIASNDKAEQLLEEEISKETEALLACLNEKDRELFYRLYVEEASMDEVSQEMDMDKSVIYNRLSRAKKKMRKSYGKV